MAYLWLTFPVELILLISSSIFLSIDKQIEKKNDIISKEKRADIIVDMGPGAGIHGGEVVAMGKPSTFLKNKKSLTAKYLTGELKIQVPLQRREGKNSKITLVGARGNNLQRWKDLR